MENTTPESPETSLQWIGAANFLRGMANNQKNLNHAQAMGEAQLRQMMGDDFQPSEDDPMKIAGQSITENHHYHFHGNGDGGKAGVGETELPQVSPTPPPPIVTPIATIDAVPPPPITKAEAAPAPSALWSTVRKIAPYALALGLGANGVLIGQFLNTAYRYKTDSKITPPTEQNEQAPPPGPDGGPIILPVPDGTMWELDLRKDGTG